MIYQVLFEEKKLPHPPRNDILKIIAGIVLFMGILIALFFSYSLYKDGFRLVLNGDIDLSKSAESATFIARTIGTLLIFSSILFIVIIIRIQQQQMAD